MSIVKKFFVILSLFFLVLTMSSCRVRTTKIGLENLAETAITEEQPSETPQEDDITDVPQDEDDLTSLEPAPQEKPQEEPEVNPKSDNKKKKSEKKQDEIKTKEESEDEPADIEDPKEDNTGEDGKDDEKDADEDTPGDINDDDPDDSSDREDLSEEDEEQEESSIRTAVEMYQQLMSANNAELYECQRLQVYFELEEEFCSITRDDYRHRFIEKAGGNNIAEIKYSDIDADWINRKQPSAIVKVVDSSVLGFGVYDSGAASSVAAEIMSRDGMTDIPAVTGGILVIISRELFDSEPGQILAELYMAKAMYPAIYGDYDLQEAAEKLLEDDSLYGYIY